MTQHLQVKTFYIMVAMILLQQISANLLAQLQGKYYI